MTNSVAVNWLKRLVRSKYIYVWLLVLLVLYLILNGYVSQKALFNNEIDRNPNNELNDPDQLSKLKERIKVLEESLESSKRNAQELNVLIRNVYKDLNDTLTLNEKLRGGAQEDSKDTKEPKIAILVISCNRAKSVENHLKQLIKHREKSTHGREKFPIIVSQDCGHTETADMISSFSSSLFASIKQPNLTDIEVSSKGELIPSHMRGYFKISRHYKWALDEVFLNPANSFESVVITEDDLNIAEDFFDYFEAMSRALAADDTLYCVSAWNDNGKKINIDTSRPDLVHRTDFFPGLGWMLRKSLWLELREKWPEAFWDDWIRNNAQRRDRACLRPEISRTDMAIEFARKGVSQGQFFDKFLSQIILNKTPVKWSDKDISQLTKKNYDPVFLDQVYTESISMSFNEYLQKSDNKELEPKRSIMIAYSSKDDFLKYAKYFDIMDDFKDGIPRTAYLGVVRVFYNQQTIYLAPAQRQNWKGYDSKWKR